MAVSGADVVKYLMQFKGTPYVWGGNSLTSGVDCSGLLQQGFAHFGISIPRRTYEQIGQGKAIGWSDLQVGDAVFFDTDPGHDGPDHVGIYIGNGKMLQAPHTGDVVKVTDITSGYWAQTFKGGRRFNGVEGGGDSNKDWASQSEVERKLQPEDMAAQYGLSWAFLNSDPSIKNIFDQAVKGNWSKDVFQAHFANTDFWKNNSDAMRKAKEMMVSDPATWQATMDANRAHILQMAQDIGAIIPDSALGDLSKNVTMMAMSDEQLKSTLSGYINFVNGSLVGQAGMYEQSMRKYAENMGVSVNQQSIKNYAQLMVKGVSSESDFQNFIKDQAVSAYPAYEDQIKNGGMTVKDIANPYIQMMAQSLEINPTTIGLDDPTIMQGLNGLDQDGKPIGKTMTEFQNMLQGDPRWRSTQQAQNKVMNIGNQVLKNMGLVS